MTETQSNDAFSWTGFVPLDRAYLANGLNQYSSVAGAGYCYDANGNLTADNQNAYLYDAENRLLEMRARVGGTCPASLTGPIKAQLRYDPLGRLLEMINYVNGVSQGAVRFVYDGNALIAEYNASGTMLRRYVHGSNIEADDPLIVYEGSAVSNTTRRYFHADPRGSIIAVTQYQGTSIATNTYDEFGIPDSASGNDIATKGRFRYTGQAWIPELGMYYYKARIYSPTLGRFLQTDPIGYEDQFNLYAYVANDPVNLTDPTGLEGCGSRIEGVNNCSGLSYFAYEASKLAEKVEVTVRQATDKAANAASDAVDLTGSIVDRLTLSPKEIVEHLSGREIPSDAYETAEKFVKQGYEWRAGQYYRSDTFHNRENKLPSSGDYVRMFAREADSIRPGYNSGERVIVDRNSGRAWYTNDKYQTFTRIR